MDTGSLEGALKQSWDAKLVASPNQRVQNYINFRKEYLGMMQPMMFPTDQEKQAMSKRKPDTTVIPMTAGMPDANLLPYEELMEFARKTWEHSRPAPLQYGASDLLKREIAKYLTRTRGKTVQPNEIYISSGNGNGLAQCFQAYLGPGDTAVVESPLWTITVNLVKQTGADVLSVGQDADGIDVDELEQKIHAAERDGKRIKLLYVQPVHHNPTGTTITKTRAERLLRLAASHSIIIVSDEPYEMYYYGAQPCYLSEMSGGFGVLTVHTFSKTLGTGLRIGFVQSQPEWLLPLQSVTMINSSVFWEYAVGELLASGKYDQIIARARGVYTEKMKVFCDALQLHVGRYLAKPPAQNGGFFVWLEFASLSAKEVFLKMKELGVDTRVGYNMYGPGHIETSHDGVAKDCHIGFSFVGPSKENLAEAARRCGLACEAVEASQGRARL